MIKLRDIVNEIKISTTSIYGITVDGNRIEFKDGEELELVDMELEELYIRSSKVKEIRCFNNELTHLILSCPNLKVLECNGNKLTQLNLSRCPNLEYIWADDETTLIGEGKTKLQEIKIDAVPYKFELKLLEDPMFVDKNWNVWLKTENVFTLLEDETGYGPDYDTLDPKNFHPRAYWDDNEISINEKYVQIVDKLHEIKIDATPKFRLQSVGYKEYKDSQGYLWANYKEDPNILSLEIVDNDFTIDEYFDLNPKDFHLHAYRANDSFIEIDVKDVIFINK